MTLTVRYCATCGWPLEVDGWCYGCCENRLPKEEEVTNTQVDEGGAIVFKDGHVLLIRSNKKPHVWLFPKGHIEPGEQPEACALREVEEETGTVASIKYKVGDLKFTRDALNYTVQYFLCEYAGDVAAKEKRTYFWCPMDKAYQVLTFPDSKSLLTEAITGKAEV